MDQLRLEPQSPELCTPLTGFYTKAENITENVSKGLCGDMGFTSHKKLRKN